MSIIRTYRELSRLSTFLERFQYLKMSGAVGFETFGFDRYLNQIFYRSKEWKEIRNFVIVRDKGFDLGIRDMGTHIRPIIHHMNPISPDDIKKNTDFLLNPDYLITTTLQTHNAIHYGDENSLPKPMVERFKNDTCPWRKEY